MKQLFHVFILLSLTVTSGWAQTVEQALEPHFGMQGGPVFRLTTIGGSSAVMMGNQNASRFGRITIGGTGFALINTDSLDVPVSMGYGGPTIGYTNRIAGPLLYITQIMIGGGGMQAGHVSTGAFVGEVDATLCLDILPFMRLTAGAGYRLVAGTDLPTYSDSDFSGANLSFGMMFGSF